jgi:hypothetical protein
VVDHIRYIHRKTWNKEKEIIPFERRGTPVPAGLDANQSRDQEILNELAITFNEATFKQLLMRWII